MSTLLADPVRVHDYVNPARPSSARATPGSPTRKRVNRTGPRVRPRALKSSPRSGGVTAPSVRNPLPLRAALALGSTEAAVPRTRIVAAPVRYRLTDRGIAAVAALVLVLICVASVTAVVRFVSVTTAADAGVGSGASISAPQVPGPVVPDAPRL